VPYPSESVNLVSTFYGAGTAPHCDLDRRLHHDRQLIQNAQAQGGITQSTVVLDMTTASRWRAA